MPVIQTMLIWIKGKHKTNLYNLKNIRHKQSGKHYTNTA